MKKPTKEILKRLEYLRGEIKAERISYGEIAELQGLAEYIDEGDIELLEWAGVPEFEQEKEYCEKCRGYMGVINTCLTCGHHNEETPKKATDGEWDEV